MRSVGHRIVFTVQRQNAGLVNSHFNRGFRLSRWPAVPGFQILVKMLFELCHGFLHSLFHSPIHKNVIRLFLCSTFPRSFSYVDIDYHEKLRYFQSLKLSGSLPRILDSPAPL